MLLEPILDEYEGGAGAAGGQSRMEGVELCPYLCPCKPAATHLAWQLVTLTGWWRPWRVGTEQ